MNKDVIKDQYGRLFYFPSELAKHRKVEVVAFCLDYLAPSLKCVSSGSPGGELTWCSYSGLSLLCHFVFRKRNILGEEGGSPDVIIGSSDCFQIVLGSFIASMFKKPFVADLYDNYESFGLAKLPLLKRFYRRALLRADAITCVSEPLAEYVRRMLDQSGGSNDQVSVLESTIDGAQFFAKPRVEVRRLFGFGDSDLLVGYGGALDSSRDIEVLYSAFLLLLNVYPTAMLVLAGVADGSCPIPKHPNIRHLGALAHDDVADFYSCLDVGVICLKDSEFGRYSFPQKAYEMIAMRIPLAVTNVGAMGRLLKDYPNVLYEAGDVEGLNRVLLQQLRSPFVVDVPIPTWEDQAKKMKLVSEGVIEGSNV